MEDKTWVSWVLPMGEGCYPVYCYMESDQAILVQKDRAAERNFVYKTDKDALDDFMVINWAYFCPEPPRPYSLDT